ncbi:MAG: glycosyltransferase family 2 protein [Alphaproteobacteria bacterium]|nr:glycosyltransferase family 2 protein [Alphaproteobacteria bacterium]MBF0356864.1 glycosyltransferase family 2 protein [Alphaproteobacteria bacterium]
MQERSGGHALATVAVPAYNCASTILAALDSIEESIAYLKALRGRNALVEILVVDDGSTDATPDLIASFAATRPHVRLLRQANKGPGAARNAGAEAGTAPVLMYLDGDDLFFPSHIAVCLDLLDAHPEAGFAKTGVRLDESVHPGWKIGISNSIVINCAVRRSVHEFIGGFFEEAPFKALHAEDALYSGLLMTFFTQVHSDLETVHHLVYPGNAFDRQRTKFSAPPQDAIEAMTEKEKEAEPEVMRIYEERRQSLARRAQNSDWSGPPINREGPRLIAAD